MIYHCTHEGYQAISSKTQKPYKLTSDMPGLRRYSAVFLWPLSTATSRGVFWWRQKHVHSNDEWVVCRVGKHQHRLAYYSSPCAKFAHTSSVKLNIMGIWEWGTYGLIGGWDGYGFWKYAEGLQKSTLSSHHMTTGFGPFELPTCSLLTLGSAVQIYCQY